VQLLLKEEVDAKDERGRTPLHLVAGNRYTAVVHLLVEKGANIDAKDKKGG
jgi:ankyrin repeat protein